MAASLRDGDAGDGQGTREAILRAAARQFAWHGYGGTSMKDIAADAGLTTGPIYHHFGSKAALYREVGDRSFAALVTSYAGLTPPPASRSRRQRVQAWFAMLAAMVDEHEDEHWIGLWLEIDAARYPEVAETREGWAREFENAFVRAGVLEDDAGARDDRALVLLTVLALGGSWNVVRNGPAALRTATQGFLRVLQDDIA